MEDIDFRNVAHAFDAVTFDTDPVADTYGVVGPLSYSASAGFEFHPREALEV